MRVTAKVTYKNSGIYEKRKLLGLTAEDLAEKVGVSRSIILDWETFRYYPRNNEKNARRIALLETVLDSTYDELFPEEYRRAVDLKLGRKVERTFEMTMPMLEADAVNGLLMPSVEDDYAVEELKDRVDKALSTLVPRQALVLRRRFGIAGDGLEYGDEQTLEEIAVDFGVNRERVRQIEAKALRNLKHPSRGSILKSYTRP